MKTCVQCQQAFEVSAEDENFYDKISPVIAGQKFLIPEPTRCPDCRRRRRLSFRNERFLYKRICDFSKKNIISTFSPDKPNKIYDREIWWSDAWDPLSYGRGFDLSKSVFEVLNEMMIQVPITNLFIDGENVNSDYTNQAGDNKNCYLIFNAALNEDCMYSRGIGKCRDSLDLYFARNDELCYECVNCHDSYNLSFSQNSDSCRDSSFLFDCTGCSNCFCCTNLRQKKYCIENIQYSQSEYESRMKEISLGLYKTWKQYAERFQYICAQAVHKYNRNINVQDCLGDYISNSKNAVYCYEVDSCEDCSYCDSVKFAKDCYDVLGSGYNSELMYETTGTGASSQNALFCWNCPTVSNLMYCINCYVSKNCFGCVSLRNKEYCIFNKQYSKEEYENLLPQVIEKMMQDKEWGEFFPSTLSPFDYNETLAQEYYPKTKEKVLSEGLKWKEDEGRMGNGIEKYDFPDSISEVSDGICQEVLICEKTGKPFKILKQELEFYRQKNLPIPRLCPDQRHLERVALRNPWKLWERVCVKCGVVVKTTYGPERKEGVYCEGCYLQEVY